MKKAIKTIVYDDELRIEAYHYEGIVQKIADKQRTSQKIAQNKIPPLALLSRCHKDTSIEETDGTQKKKIEARERDVSLALVCLKLILQKYSVLKRSVVISAYPTQL